MKNILIITFFLYAVQAYAVAYLPQISSYDKKEYKAGRQNWDISMDHSGNIYFANTDGLLCYIYGEWTLEKVSGEGSLRSVLAQSDTIWCGGEQFGYFAKDDNNKLRYTFLGNADGGPIWNIEAFNNYVYFQTEYTLYCYDKVRRELSEQYYRAGIWSIIAWNNEFWMIRRNGEIGTLNHLSFSKVLDCPAFRENEVRCLFIHHSQMHIVTLGGEVFACDGKEIEQIDIPQLPGSTALFTGMSYNADSYCLGGICNGLLLLDNNNVITNAIDASSGLIDNTVLSMATDAIGNIWLGLDYGIAKLELQSAIKPIFDQGASYFISDFNNKTYLSTNKGLFCSKNREKFHLLPTTEGQVWRTKIIDNRLYICHNKGLLTLEKGKVKTLFDGDGIMDLTQFGNTDFFLLSSYSALLLMKREHKSFRPIDTLRTDFDTKLHYDKGTNCIYADTPESRLMKITLSENKKIIKEEYSQIKSFFDTKAGLFFYDGEKLLISDGQQFLPMNNALIDNIKEQDIKALDISADLRTLAYIQNSRVKLSVSLHDGCVYTYDKLFNALNTQLIRDNEYIDISKQLIRIATDRGVIVFDTNFESRFKPKNHPVISSLKVIDEPENQFFSPYKKNTVHLEAGRKNLLLRFGQKKTAYDLVEYRYRMQPIEEQWSEWKTDYKALYTNLKGGKYQFFLESRTNGGPTEENSLFIEIQKCWHQTPWLILPVFLAFAAWMLLVIYLTSHVEKAKNKKRQEKSEQKNAGKMLAMKNDQLLQYIEIISHKNEFLNKIKFGLEKMRNADAQRWINKINNEVNNEKKEFLFHKLFSEVHQDFIARITHAHPSLTSNDVRLLSFIRVNLESREIANLMNISPKSVDTNRYRLRKKMHLAHEIDLNQFVRDF